MRFRCRDYLRLFLDLDRQDQVLSHPWNHELCGNISAIPKQHYSSTNILMMKFHSENAQHNRTGFRGIYKFIDKGNLEWITSSLFGSLTVKVPSRGRPVRVKHDIV